MTRHGIRIGRIFGIEITIDWSWLIVAALMVTHLTLTFRAWHPDWAPGLAVAVAAVATGVLFGSILFHELAHSLVAMAQGMRVRGIRFFLFGGVSQLEREHASAGKEVLTSIAGPLSSLVLGTALLIAFAVRTVLLPGQASVTAGPTLLPALDPLGTLLLWAGTANVGLALFNSIPAFPLDGGRVLRGILWWASGDLRRATRWAAGTGQLIAGAFIAAGLAMVFGAELPFVGGGVIGGIWLSFIGWFLLSAAAQSHRLAVMEDALAPVTVGRLMRTDVPAVDADAPLARILDAWIHGDDDTFLVTRAGSAVGVVSIASARAVPADRWAVTPVATVATDLREVRTVAPDIDAAAGLRLLLEEDRNAVPVVQHGRCLGMLHLRDLLRWIEVQDAEPNLWQASAARR